MTTRVGIIGIGHMGLAMALRLRDLGHAVGVCDIDPRQVAQARAHGAEPFAAPADLARRSELLIIAVVDAAQVEAVLFGAGGAAPALRAGACVLLCPTVEPACIEAVAARLADLGVDAIDAPMSGGPARARAGCMSLMVACAAPVYERHRTWLEALANPVFRIGERLGDGARAKLVNNLVAAVNLAGAAEGIALARRVGLDAAGMLAVIEQSSGQSWIGSDRLRRAVAGDASVHAHTRLLAKDSRLALAMADAAGCDPAVGRRAAALFADACAAGLAMQDDASLLGHVEAASRAVASPVATQPLARPTIDATLASRYAGCALRSLDQAYPHALQHLMRSAEDQGRPETLHPIFHGSYDWHSSVHMHWSLVRLLRLVPDLPERAAILARLERVCTPENVAVERAYLHDHPAFERPYGWAWLLLLQTELSHWARAGESRARRWAERLEPMVELLRQRWIEHLALVPVPQRAGTHPNSAFALCLALAHARSRGDDVFAERISEVACRWFGADRHYPAAYEPSASDFLSGGLCEAVLMRAVLTTDEAFGRWWQRFRPREADLAQWLEPAPVASRCDAQLVHADGLNLSRAWCLGVLAPQLAEEGPRFTTSRERHLAAALPHVTGGDFVATHWLVSFALLAMSGLVLPD